MRAGAQIQDGVRSHNVFHAIDVTVNSVNGEQVMPDRSRRRIFVCPRRTGRRSLHLHRTSTEVATDPEQWVVRPRSRLVRRQPGRIPHRRTGQMPAARWSVSFSQDQRARSWTELGIIRGQHFVSLPKR
jgi:hypothetical protein